MAEALVLRPLRWWDIAGVQQLEAALFAETAWSVETFWAELAQPNRTYLLAEQHGAVVGYGGVMVNGADADLQTVGVAAPAQGQGLGRKLLRALLAAASAAGATRILLEVRADNLAAQSLYRSEGFAQIALRARYYQPGNVDAVIMRARLTAE